MRSIQLHLLIFAFLTLARLSCRPLLLLAECYKRYKNVQAFEWYRLQQELLRSQQNIPKQFQNRPSPKRAKDSIGDEAAVLRHKSHVSRKELREKRPRARKATQKREAIREKEEERQIDYILNSMRSTQPHLLISAFLALARLSCRPLMRLLAPRLS